MTKVFVSYASEDRAVVEPLIEELTSVNLQPYDYVSDMPPGGEIARQLMDRVDEVVVAIFCLSSSYVAKPWTNHELAWCVQALGDGDKPMRRLIPIQVGDLDPDEIPALIADVNVPMIEEDDPVIDVRRPALSRWDLINDIRVDLDLPPFRKIYASIVAINEDQWPETKAIWNKCALKSLYETFGEAPKTQPGVLAERYGPTALDFSPHDDIPLRTHIQTALNLANRESAPENHAAIQWIDPLELADSDDLAASWRSGRHLLLVDAVSLLNEELRTACQGIIAISRMPERGGLVWLGPQTRYTEHVPQMINEALLSSVWANGCSLVG